MINFFFQSKRCKTKLVNNEGQKGPFIYKSLWLEAEAKGVQELKDLIEKSLIGTSISVLLVGSETSPRKWLKYEVVKSFTEGKAVLIIYLNRIRTKNK